MIEKDCKVPHRNKLFDWHLCSA